ncbi:MAG: AraC family transcriptional regulator [Saccharofermentans sp.]|nr:AraC family transcriptional regulator [Saccharofermentans sp.]
MQNLYEYSDIKDHRYECFTEDHNGTYEVRMHWHYFMEVMHILEGSVKVTVGRSEIDAVPGDLVVLLPSAMHAIKTGEEHTRYSVIKFTPGTDLSWSESALLSLASDKSIKIHFKKEELKSTNIPMLIEGSVLEMEQKNIGYIGIIRANLQIVMTSLIRLWEDAGVDLNLFTAPAETYMDIEALPSYIDANIKEPLIATEVASMCNMSYSRFARRFKKVFGRTFKEYVQYVRVTKASELLKTTGMDLEQISAGTGFTDSSHLIRVFKQEFKTTPNRYRNS